MNKLALVAALLFAASAAAQTRSDLMDQATPTEPPQPPQQPGAPNTPRYYYPGQPIQQMPNYGYVEPAPAPSEGAKPGAKEQPRQGLFVPEGGVEPNVSVENQPVETAPETHTVQKGDTLWDLSARYLSSPWSWPKLWSWNPAITNPHWIYPGDVIRLYPPGTTPPPQAAHPELPPPRITGGMRPRKGVFLRQIGFAEDKELAVAGKIVGSKEEKRMLSTLDEAYVEFPKNQPMQVGERYTIYMPIGVIKHPVTGKTLGQKVQIYGEAEVRAVTAAHIARVVIVDSTDPVERGFYVGPLRREFKIVQPKRDARNLRGVVVAVLRPHELVAADNIVFVDQGRDEGLEVGNRLLVVRRGDG